MASNNGNGSNDLNMILSAKVVKLRVELDAKGSDLPTQVNKISEMLEDKPVKLKVKLSATIKDLNKQINKISTTINESKTFEPLKIKVELDVKGSATAIKGQLEDILKTVDEFNKKYGKSLDRMNNLSQKEFDKISKGNEKINIKTDVDVQGINNIKKYNQILEQTKKILTSKYPDDGKGLFSSVQIKDANGNLVGFTASLKRADGVIDTLRYKFDKNKEAFVLIDRKTATQTEEQLKNAVNSLKNLEREIDKTGDKAKEFKSDFNNLMQAGKNGTLTNDMVKDYERLLKNKQAQIQAVSKENDLYVKQQKILKDISTEMNRAFKKDNNMDTRSSFKNIATSVKNDGSEDNIKRQRLELEKLTDALREKERIEKQNERNEKNRIAYREKWLTLERNSVSTDKTSKKYLIESDALIKVAKTGKDWIRVQELMSRVRVSNANDKNLQKSLDIQRSLREQLTKLANHGRITENQLSKSLQQIPMTAMRSFADLERQLKVVNRKVKDAQADAKRLSSSTELEINPNNPIVLGMRNAIDNKDILSLQNYIGQLYKGKVEIAEFEATEDKLGRAVDRVNVKMKGKGKTIQNYVLDLDKVTGQLRQVSTGITYNANRNLGVIEQLKVALERVPTWMGAMTVWYGSINAIRNMATEILNVDKALTELRRVADADINIERIFEGSVNLSKELGNNIHDVMQTMNDFARTFGDLNERQLLDITKTATLLSNVSDLTAEEAGNSLVGTMNAFNIQASETIRIADAFNEVDNNFAISTKQLATGMAKSASTAQTFGVTLEENIGNITAIGAVTMESGNIIGNSLKTIYSRITTLGGVAPLLEKVGVNMKEIGENGEEVRPVNDILNDLGRRWGSITKEQQQNIAVTVAGRYQLSRFLALMNNYEMALEATGVAYDSQGSAMRENSEYLKSFEARINIMKNGFTELALAVGDAVLSDGMMVLFNGLTSLANIATTVVDKVGALSVVFGVLSIALMKFGYLDKIQGSIGGMVNYFSSAEREARKVSKTMDVAGSNVVAFGTSASNAGKATAGGMTVASTATKGLSASLKGLLASTIVGAGFVVLGIAIEKLIGAIANLQEKQKLTEESTKKQIQAYHDYGNSFDDLIGKYEVLADKHDKNKEAMSSEELEEYLSLNNELANALPNTVKYVDANGDAHLYSADQIKLEAERVRELAEAQALLDYEKQEDAIKKSAKAYSDTIEEYNKLEKEREKLESQKGRKTKAETVNVEGFAYQIDDSSGMQDYLKLGVDMQLVQADMMKASQGIVKTIQEQINAGLTSTGVMRDLTDSQRAMIENYVQINSSKIESVMEIENETERNKELAKIQKEMITQGVELGNVFSETYGELTKGLEGKPEELNELNKNMQLAMKAVPDDFLKVDEKSGRTFEKIKEDLKEVIKVTQEIDKGSLNFGDMVTSLTNAGMSSDVAKGYVADLVKEMGNADQRAQSASEGLDEFTNATEDLTEAVLEAINPINELLGVDNNMLSGIQSHIQTLKILKDTYKDTYAETDAWSYAITDLAMALGVSEEYIENNLGYLDKLFDALSKVSYEYDSAKGTIITYGEATDEQKKMVQGLIQELGGEKNLIEFLESGYLQATGVIQENTEVKKENAQTTRESTEAKKLEEQAVKDVTNAFSIYRENMNKGGRSEYISSIKSQLDLLGNQITVVKDDSGKLKLTMADGSESQFLKTLNGQLDTLGIKLNVIDDGSGNFKVTLNDGSDSQVLTTYKKQADETKQAVESATDKVKLFKEAQLEQKNNSGGNSNEAQKYKDMASQLDNNIAKADLLNLAVSEISSSVSGLAGSFSTYNNLVQNMKTTTDTILNNASSFDVIKTKVNELGDALVNVQGKMGSIFNGLNISNQAMDNIESFKIAIFGIAESAEIMASYVNSSFNTMNTNISRNSSSAISSIDTMGNAMYREFRSSMDDIVSSASSLPARIGQAIRNNMSQASSSMNAVAKDMVKRFKKELGIHSPSRVFEGLGGDVIAGLANGLSGGDLKSLGKSVFSDFGGGVFDSMESIKGYVSGDMGGLVGKVGGGVNQWSSLATKALMMTGQYSEANLQRMLMQMTSESGGNAKAINLWDSNAKKGIPSKGLMQVIDPTFKSYAHPQYNKNIYDPLSNMLASIRYSVSRYGSLNKAWKGKGYEEGGIIDHQHIAMVGEGNKKEAIIPLEQHKNRAIDLWNMAGQHLGIDTSLLSLLSRGRGGQSYGSGGSFGASSGEGSGATGGGDSGTSGVMQTSIYDGMRTFEGGYDFIALNNLADPFKVDNFERTSAGYESQIGVLEAKMRLLNEGTAKYRDTLKQIITLSNSNLKTLRDSLTATKQRQTVIQAELRKLPALSKHSEAQRETYNTLMQEFDSNVQKINSLTVEIESSFADISEKSLEVFSDFINEIVANYETAIDKIKSLVDDIDLQIEITTLVNPTHKKALLDAQASRATALQSQVATSRGQLDALHNQHGYAVATRGANSEEAKLIREQLVELTEAHEDYYLELLKAEKDIRDLREDIADGSIDTLKDYYGNVKDMALEAIELETKALEKAHDSKMKLYDEEIEKINSVYNAKIQEIDKQKEEDTYQEQLSEKSAKRTELTNKMSLLSRDNSLEGRKKLSELQAELTTLNKEISDFQKDRQNELLKESLEQQKETQITAIESQKETAEAKHQDTLTMLEQQKQSVDKYYSDLINNDAYWSMRRDEAILGNFNILNTELAKMETNMEALNNGIFGGLNTGLVSLSDEVKKQLGEINRLMLDNMILGSKESLSNVSEALKANGYNMTNGNAGVSYVPIPTNNPIAPPTPAPAPKPAPAPAPKPAPAPAPAPAVNPNRRRTTSALQFRRTPAYGNNVLSTLPRGAEVEYVGMEKGWAKIKYGGKTGYVGSKYLQKFESGGYTGDNIPKGGALAVLHKKEQVFNKDDTKNLLDASKLLRGMGKLLPSIKLGDVSSIATAGLSNSSSVSYGDINIVIENGDKKKGKDIVNEIMKELGKKGK